MSGLGFFVLAAICVIPAAGQNETAVSASANPAEAIDSRTVRLLLDRLTADEERIRELESQLKAGMGYSMAARGPVPAAKLLPAVLTEITSPPSPDPAPGGPTPMPSQATARLAPQEASDPDADAGTHGHMMELPGGGPTLTMRGFADLNYTTGPNGNPLIYPLGTASHSTFQMGEFDLFLSSKLSRQISFLGEVVVGSDATNRWGIDIERLQLTWRPGRWFEISGGRYHTAIGYYNTAFHHGTWFQTDTGRPFMYYFEDSGGILPVHNVGVTTTGLVPGSGKFGLHWIAEVGNGVGVKSNNAPVQNFVSERTHKSINFAFYAKPEWLPGLQFGAGIYRDRLFPDSGIGVSQSIRSAYVVYQNSNWEFLNEGVWMRHQILGESRTYNTPLMYSQISRRFREYRPYFRYQYVNSPATDPLNQFTGRYSGPSVGSRYNFSEYVAFKVQYNRIYPGSGNGVDLQLAFAF